MTNPPEPLDVGPIAGGHLPVQERDKAQVASLLRTAAAEGRLTQPELDDRLHGVHVATSFDDLIPLTRDLVPLAPRTNVLPSTALAPTSTEPTFGFSMFGGSRLTPAISIAPTYSLFTMLGGGSLDLTRAPFVNGVCEVTVFCMFGGITVYVPPGVNVQNQTVAIFGGAGNHKLAPALQGAPTVIVRGFVAFGGVGVQHPK